MDYSKIIELDNVTIEDCANMYTNSNLMAVISDGKLINFKKENDN